MTNARRVLAASAVIEAMTGIGLVVLPQLLTRLLFGVEATGAGVATCGVAGVALMALAAACWPRGAEPIAPNCAGLLTYNGFCGVLLAGIGLQGELVGPLLWPAVAAHLAFAAVIIGVILVSSRKKA